MIYIIGSLRNSKIPDVAAALREAGLREYSEWYSAGPTADEWWQKCEEAKGHTYAQALEGWHAKHVFETDVYHLNRADAGLLVLPAGPSAHLEAGYLVGNKKPVVVLFDQEPARFDIMRRFTKVCYTVPDAITLLKSLL